MLEFEYIIVIPRFLRGLFILCQCFYKVIKINYKDVDHKSVRCVHLMPQLDVLSKEPAGPHCTALHHVTGPVVGVWDARPFKQLHQARHLLSNGTKKQLIAAALRPPEYWCCKYLNMVWRMYMSVCLYHVCILQYVSVDASLFIIL